MSNQTTHPLIVITSIVFLSLFVAWVLFSVLSSEGTFNISSESSFGGAAAGFFATLFGLRHWYTQLDKRRNIIKDPELIKAIASLISIDLVRSVEGDSVALTTKFNDIQQYLPIQFRSLGTEWVGELIREFYNETLLTVRAYASIKDWKPPKESTSLIQDM